MHNRIEKRVIGRGVFLIVALFTLLAARGYQAEDNTEPSLGEGPLGDFGWMLGDWDIESRRPNQEGKWATIRETSGKFVLIADGAGIQGKHRDVIGGLETEVVWTLSWDQYRKEYRVTILEAFSGLLDVYEGDFDDEGVFIATNLHSGTLYAPQGQDPVAGRIKFEAIEENSFVYSWSYSSDDGQTWVPVIRKKFARAQ